VNRRRKKIGNGRIKREEGMNVEKERGNSRRKIKAEE
jgi:hypothetical protein